MDVRTFRPGKSPGKKGMSYQNILKCWYISLLTNYFHFIHNPPLALSIKCTFNTSALDLFRKTNILQGINISSESNLGFEGTFCAFFMIYSSNYYNYEKVIF